MTTLPSIDLSIADTHGNYITGRQALLVLSFYDVLLGSLQGIFQDPLEDEAYPTFAISRHDALSLLTWLKLSNQFDMDTPLDCFATDSLARIFRFTVFYALQSSYQNCGLKVVTKSYETKPVLSTQDIYPAMNWAERELWDLSGVLSLKHPDLRRILTYYGFVGHPIHKDFPLSGFREVAYDNGVSRVGYENLELSQNLRSSTVTEPTVWTRYHSVNAKAF